MKEDIEEAFLVRDGGHGNDPSTFDETMSDIDFKKQLDILMSEIDSMHLNQVWSLIDPLEEIASIGCKQIYKRKIDADDKVETYKAMLVGKDYSQHEGIDYHDIFLLVAMLKSTRTLVAVMFTMIIIFDRWM